MYIDIDENGSLSTSRPCHTASSTFLASSSLPLSFFPPFRCGMMVLVVLEGHSRRQIHIEIQKENEIDCDGYREGTKLYCYQL